MGSKKKRLLRQRAQRDAQYRRALDVAPDGSLPSKIGQAASGGGARGGRGSAQKGRGRNS